MTITDIYDHTILAHDSVFDGNPFLSSRQIYCAMVMEATIFMGLLATSPMLNLYCRYPCIEFLFCKALSSGELSGSAWEYAMRYCLWPLHVSERVDIFRSIYNMSQREQFVFTAKMITVINFH